MRNFSQCFAFCTWSCHGDGWTVVSWGQVDGRDDGKSTDYRLREVNVFSPKANTALGETANLGRLKVTTEKGGEKGEIDRSER